MTETKKTVWELKGRLAEVRSRMQDMNDAAEVAKRAFTPEEEKEWERLTQDAASISRSLTIASYAAEPELARDMREYADYGAVYRVTSERALAGAAFRNLLEARQKTGAQIELRDVIATTSTQVAGAVPVLVKDFIEPLEKGIIYGMLGIKIQTGLTSDVKYPITPYITAMIAGETIELTDTTITLKDLMPKPQKMGATIPLTGLSNIKTDGAVYNWVVNNLSLAVARTLNRWMFQPTAVADGLHGVFSYNEAANPIQQKPLSATPTYQELLALRGAVMSTGAYPDGTYAYVMSGMMYATLEATPVNPNGGDKMIITDGKIGGVPVFITEEIECLGGTQYNVVPKHVGFGRFSDCMAHQFGGMRLIVDPYSESTADVTRTTINTYWSVDLVRAKSFVIGTIGA